MNLTLSIDDEILEQARRLAEATGTSVNQLVRDYIARIAGKSDVESGIADFRELTRNAKGDSRGWKFNRDEIHERR